MKKQAAVALVISLLLLVLFVAVVGWEAVFAALGRATVRIYALAFVATLACLLCRTLVWHRMLSVVDRPRPYWLVGGLFLTAMFAKYVAPYGQVTSGVGVAAVVSRYYDSAYEEALAAVASADFLNYVPYYTFGSIALGYVFFVDAPPIPLEQHAPVVAALVVAVVAFVAVVLFRRELLLEAIVYLASAIRPVLERIAPQKASQFRRENVISRFEGFYGTLDVVSHDRRAMVIALGYAHAGWLAFAGALYASAAAVGSPVTFAVAMAAVALSKVGFLVPTPGGLGGVEAALAGVLIVLSPMSSAVALAVAILYRFATYWFTILVGGVATIALTLADPLPPEAG
ncbi:lysylphosphatidylglycerol synthase transmembrane domain-containing protein [Natrarchaeobaculum sulfurireducens]|uniref:Integral membrane protein n=1 Tax=Natrarchaeobaculum sulfurireducens TaxID=2044521 RepID=A0A346PAF1_9EURY|nr:lysylphosphatidylglycerol synthase transmembrane domain-containing protein [Natrarchaeobaculum sulfurireducens]AXR76496.1 hypothetical protein AArc1_0144 [Natrarchaeobaculum sulfurireducens]AXR80172.1 hypothetical protein AArcMg_0141 [Natrarchaeobaculum sulfurireducens]